MPSLVGRGSSGVLASSSSIPYGGPSHILLQIGPSLVDVKGEYRGGVIEEEIENEGGGASVE